MRHLRRRPDACDRPGRRRRGGDRRPAAGYSRGTPVTKCRAAHGRRRGVPSRDPTSAGVGRRGSSRTRDADRVPRPQRRGAGSSRHGLASMEGGGRVRRRTALVGPPPKVMGHRPNRSVGGFGLGGRARKRRTTQPTRRSDSPGAREAEGRRVPNVTPSVWLLRTATRSLHSEPAHSTDEDD